MVVECRMKNKIFYICLYYYSLMGGYLSNNGKGPQQIYVTAVLPQLTTLGRESLSHLLNNQCLTVLCNKLTIEVLPLHSGVRRCSTDDTLPGRFYNLIIKVGGPNPKHCSRYQNIHDNVIRLCLCYYIMWHCYVPIFYHLSYLFQTRIRINIY